MSEWSWNTHTHHERQSNRWYFHHRAAWQLVVNWCPTVNWPELVCVVNSVWCPEWNASSVERSAIIAHIQFVIHTQAHTQHTSIIITVRTYPIWTKWKEIIRILIITLVHTFPFWKNSKNPFNAIAFNMFFSFSFFHQKEKCSEAGVFELRAKLAERLHQPSSRRNNSIFFPIFAFTVERSKAPKQEQNYHLENNYRRDGEKCVKTLLLCIAKQK